MLIGSGYVEIYLSCLFFVVVVVIVVVLQKVIIVLVEACLLSSYPIYLVSLTCCIGYSTKRVLLHGRGTYGIDLTLAVKNIT